MSQILITVLLWHLYPNKKSRARFWQKIYNSFRKYRSLWKWVLNYSCSFTSKFLWEYWWFYLAYHNLGVLFPLWCNFLSILYTILASKFQFFFVPFALKSRLTKNIFLWCKVFLLIFLRWLLIFLKLRCGWLCLLLRIRV